MLQIRQVGGKAWWIPRLLSRTHDTGSITSVNSADGGGNHFGCSFLTSALKTLSFAQSRLCTYSVTSTSNNKRGSRTGRKGRGWGLLWDMEDLAHSLSGSSNPSPCASLSTLLHSISRGTRPEAGGHWETGEQSGISNQAIRYLPPQQAAQLDPRTPLSSDSNA